MNALLRTARRLVLLLLVAVPVPALAAGEPPEAGATAEQRPTPPQVPSPAPRIAAGEVETARFRIVYTERSKGAARALAERIEEVRDHFQAVLGRDWPGVTEIRVGHGRAEFESLALPGGRPPKWAEALAYPERNIILLDALSLLRPGGETTLWHELSHVALGQLGDAWPHWFQEGIAMYLTGDRLAFSQYAAMFRGVTQDRLYSFEDLGDGWPQHPGDVEIAYAQSMSFVDYLVGRYGPKKMGELVDHVHAGSSFELAFARAFQSTLRVEQEGWEKTLPSRYSWLPIVTGGTVIWTLAAGLTVAGWWRRRRQRAAKLIELEAQEAAEEAALRLAAALNQVPEASAGALPLPADPDPEVPEEPPGARPQEDDDALEDGKPRRTLH